jgi:penicillin amidase
MANAWLPVPGWSDEYEWRGFVPFEEMLRSRNPDTGYIVTANNKIAGDDYPHYISLYYGSDGRARRILGKVRGLTGATVEDMADVHGDIVSMPGRTYAALLGDIEPEDATTRRAVGMLADWDGSMHRDLVAPTVYSAFRRELDLRVLAPLLGPLSDEAFGATGRGAPRQVGHLSALLASHAAEGDTSMLPDGADWSSVATRALETAVGYLRGRLGDDVDSWQWGRIHGTVPRHLLSDSFPGLAGLLDPPSTPMSGDGDTPHSASYNAGDPFTVTGTSVARYVFDASDWDNSRWVVPLGASGHPGSSHYADQRPVWADDEVVPMLYTWEAIEAAAETRQILKPRHGD